MVNSWRPAEVVTTDNGVTTSSSNQPRKQCVTRNNGNGMLDAHVVIGDFTCEHNHQY